MFISGIENKKLFLKTLIFFYFWGLNIKILILEIMFRENFLEIQIIIQWYTIF